MILRHVRTRGFPGGMCRSCGTAPTASAVSLKQCQSASDLELCQRNTDFKVQASNRETGGTVPLKEHACPSSVLHARRCERLSQGSAFAMWPC